MTTIESAAFAASASILKVLRLMKLRPVLLVLVLLSGFYYVTTRGAATGNAVGWLRGPLYTAASEQQAKQVEVEGPHSAFNLTEASAAPAFDSEEQQNIAVYRKALPSVVNITSTAVAFDFFNRPVPQQGQGSGFILDPQGHILTNNHVIDNAQRVEVTLYDKHKYHANVVAIDKQHDLALLLINAPNLVPATLSQSNGLMVGQRVYAIGNPFGLSGTLTRGIISAIRSIGTQGGAPIEDAIQTDAAINPGNSGGPLLNSKGEVIGITTLIASNGSDQSAGIGFAIPINTAKAVLDDFAKFGRVRRPSLDIVTLPIGPDIAEQIGLPADYGILIERTLPGGAAEKAGLHGGNQRLYQGNTPVYLGGDLIVALDGQEIESPQDLSAALNTHRAGDTVTVTIFRGQRRMNIKVVLGDAKDAIQLPGNSA
jgi:S1-C subfamily serine protease